MPDCTCHTGRCALSQHWLRTQPHPYWCPICNQAVTKWHEHIGGAPGFPAWSPSKGLRYA